jgi:hypothetical protein
MILDKYTTFHELISEINSFSDIKICFGGVKEHNGITFVGKGLPISINEHEFNYMHDFIIKHKLVCGYELATGTGISALSSAIALKKNNGILLTMDNYIEDKIQEQQINLNNDDILTNSDSYNFVKQILKFYSLDNVELVVGNSPKDSVKIFDENNHKFDYIFLDCPKCDNDFERDILSIKNNLKDKFAIFVHDTHTFTEISFKLIENIFGVNIILIDEYYENTEFHSKRKYPLGLITNIEKI